MGRRSKRPDSGVSGCVVVDKTSGCTSHDVVDQLRKILGTRKVGHAGTLDPDATGVLVFGVGQGTKLLQFVTGATKSYVGDVVFGVETSTLDSSGEITARYEMDLTTQRVAEASKAFVGEIKQVPPMVSAIRVDGERLHDLARKGIEVEREARPVTVSRFEVEPTESGNVYRVKIDCSSGTYIRSLAADLGTALGGGAHLKNLRRTRVGSFSLGDAVTLDDSCSAESILRPLVDMVGGLATLEVDQQTATKVKHGQKLSPTLIDSTLASAIDETIGSRSNRLAVIAEGRLIAIYEKNNDALQPLRVLA